MQIPKNGTEHTTTMKRATRGLMVTIESNLLLPSYSPVLPLDYKIKNRMTFSLPDFFFFLIEFLFLLFAKIRRRKK